MHRTLPAELTGEQAMTLFLAASVAPSLTPDELDESIPRLRHLAELMVSRRTAAPAPTDVDPPTMPIEVQPLDPPTGPGAVRAGSAGRAAAPRWAWSAGRRRSAPARRCAATP